MWSRRSYARRFPESSSAWPATVDRPPRDIALVVAEEPLAAVIADLYRVYGFEVRTAATPLGVVLALIGAGERVGAVVISPDARWADGVDDFVADEYPEIDRIVLAA